jgi:multicomponent Na+:H+ antiporter subunit A
LTLYFASFITPVAAGSIFTVAYSWVPSLGVNLALYIDGLGLFFALLITSIGTLVLIYAGSYLAGHHHLGRFYIYLLTFMAAMLQTAPKETLLVNSKTPWMATLHSTVEGQRDRGCCVK